MVSSLEHTALRFFNKVGLVEPTGYRTIEVLLQDSVQSYFDGQDYLLLTFSSEVARENPEAQLLSYGSPLLDSMTEASLALGDAAHIYLNGLHLSRGRTLEKVRQHVRIPGHVLEVGKEQPYLYHHALFRFKVSLVADIQEEAFYDVAVDLHSGWTTMKLEESMLHLYGSQEPEVFPETNVELGLDDACSSALDELRKEIAPLVQTKELALASEARSEKIQVAQHYQSMVERLEAGRSRKGANLERIEDRIRSTMLDRGKRLEDVDRKYRLGVEVSLVQLAVVSYPKIAVPLRVQQGKDQTLGLAAWDSLIHSGYFHILSQPADLPDNRRADGRQVQRQQRSSVDDLERRIGA